VRTQLFPEHVKDHTSARLVIPSDVIVPVSQKRKEKRRSCSYHLWQTLSRCRVRHASLAVCKKLRYSWRIRILMVWQYRGMILSLRVRGVWLCPDSPIRSPAGRGLSGVLQPRSSRHCSGSIRSSSHRTMEATALMRQVKGRPQTEVTRHGLSLTTSCIWT
jgi:hypothetical protein